MEGLISNCLKLREALPARDRILDWEVVLVHIRPERGGLYRGHAGTLWYQELRIFQILNS